MKKPVAERGQLAGMPIPIKDLVDVAGVRCTQGSPIYANHIPDEVRRSGRASRSRRRHRLRDVEHAGIRRRRQHLQRGVRQDAQSVEHVALGGRLLGRRGGRACDRHGVARARLRHGRQPAQSGELQRHRRLPAEHRARRAHAERRDRHEPRPAGADGAQRRGRGAAARRDERRGPARSVLAAAHRRVVSGGGALGLAAEARRVVGRSRHHDGRQRGRGDHPQGGASASPSLARRSRRRIRI